jgi:AraC-like DNA-binding protein
LIWTPGAASFQAGDGAARELFDGDYALAGGRVPVRLLPGTERDGGPVYALGMGASVLQRIATELQSVSRARIRLDRLMNDLDRRPSVDRQPGWLATLLADLDQAAVLGMRDPAWLRHHARLIWERLIFSRAVQRPGRLGRPRRPVPSARNSALSQRLRRVRELLESEYHRPLDLTQMASVACVSRYHFLREFRKAYGKTPYQLLIDIRLAAARRMLRSGELPVQEIGRRVGFASADGFYRAFRRRYQRSPSAFRDAG